MQSMGWTHMSIVNGQALIDAGINEQAVPSDLFRVDVEVRHAPWAGKHAWACDCGASNCTGYSWGGGVTFIPVKKQAGAYVEIEYVEAE